MHARAGCTCACAWCPHARTTADALPCLVDGCAQGVPGVVVGGAFGGAAGYVTERIEQARAYISGAYHERVETEKQNAAQMASTHEELKSLDEVRVRADDPEEAAELTRAMLEFLAEPANWCASATPAASTPLSLSLPPSADATMAISLRVSPALLLDAVFAASVPTARQP